jgi:hypothetical protein
VVDGPLEKRSSGIQTQRWEENIIVDLMENYFYDVD